MTLNVSLMKMYWQEENDMDCQVKVWGHNPGQSTHLIFKTGTNCLLCLTHLAPIYFYLSLSYSEKLHHFHRASLLIVECGYTDQRRCIHPLPFSPYICLHLYSNSKSKFLLIPQVKLGQFSIQHFPSCSLSEEIAHPTEYNNLSQVSDDNQLSGLAKRREDSGVQFPWWDGPGKSLLQLSGLNTEPLDLLHLQPNEPNASGSVLLSWPMLRSVRECSFNIGGGGMGRNSSKSGIFS